jgi:hypothetical protein
MSSPSETASAHQAGPADDRNRSEPSWHPADAIPEDDPRSPVPAAPEYPFVNALGSAAAEPDLAGPDDAAAPFSVSPASPAAGPGSAPAAPVARTAQAGAHAGRQSSRCSSMIRAHLLSWRPVSSATASSRSSCPSRSSSIHCCLPGTAMMREPRNCARHSGSTAHSGTASRISPVKPDHLPLAAASSSTWPAQVANGDQA